MPSTDLIPSVAPSGHPRLVLALTVLATVVGSASGLAQPALAVPPSSRTRVEESATAVPMDRTLARDALARRAQLRDRLAGIRIPEARFEHLPLSEVVKFLAEASAARSGEATPVNFIISAAPPLPPPSMTLDPGTGAVITLPPPEPVVLADVTIRLDPPLRHVRLLDLLDAVVRTASLPIRYSLEEYAVVFQHGAEAAPLATRVFRVDAARLARALEDTVPLLDEAPRPQARSSVAVAGRPEDDLKRLFRQLGITLRPPNAVFFNARLGVLTVRVSEDDLEVLEAALVLLGIGQTPTDPTPR